MNKLFFTAQKLREMEAIVSSGDIGPMTRETVALMLKQAAEMKERLAAVVKHLEKYKGTKEPDYCCADCIEDIAKEVGFSFASGEGGAE